MFHAGRTIGRNAATDMADLILAITICTLILERRTIYAAPWQGVKKGAAACAELSLRFELMDVFGPSLLEVPLVSLSCLENPRDG